VAQARETFRATVTPLAVKDLVFVDESGVTTTMTRLTDTNALSLNHERQ
jgi:hypothetical protein